MDAYFARCDELFSTFKQIIDEEMKLIDLLDTRVKYLQQVHEFLKYYSLLFSFGKGSAEGMR